MDGRSVQASDSDLRLCSRQEAGPLTRVCSESDTASSIHGISAPGIQHDPGQYPSLFDAWYQWLEKIKERFGENSKESVTIHDTCGAFRFGTKAKTDVYSTIQAQLVSSKVLFDEFQDILRNVAKQDRRDFEIDYEGVVTQPLQQQYVTPPEYLESRHQPQLPSLSSIGRWRDNEPYQPVYDKSYGISHACEPTLNQGYGQAIYRPMSNSANQCYSNLQEEHQQDIYHSLHSSSPSLSQIPNQQPPSLPPIDQIHVSAMTLHRVSNFGSQTNAVIQGIGSPRTMSMNEAWDRAEYETTLDQGFFNSEWATIQSQTSPGISPEEVTPHVVSPHFTPVNATQSVIGTPDMNDLVTPLLPVAARASVASQSSTTSSRRSSSTQGVYIHQICGKAFHSRAGVKKHHWGHKIGDLKTRTGCWNLHRRPDIEWDAHPSCRLGQRGSPWGRPRRCSAV
ncbi:hypothetical protein BCR34DRAFT_393936 [Clohesyomyces aquaticus]|uniref:Uncharacterized protein n=1 Tax=Clohesyomyces aquaticus TaxID=1231657 RepID=A0A1Y1ZE80_9PLEO|nr:hypothetical protein BCR34DRAFT_393936 [Clohesyomyces aquaticus]